MTGVLGAGTMSIPGVEPGQLLESQRRSMRHQTRPARPGRLPVLDHVGDQFRLPREGATDRAPWPNDA